MGKGGVDGPPGLRIVGERLGREGEWAFMGEVRGVVDESAGSLWIRLSKREATEKTLDLCFRYHNRGSIDGS